MESLEERTLLDGGLTNVPLGSEQVQALRGGLQGLTDFLDTVGAHDRYSQPITLLNRSIGQVMNLGGTLRQGLFQPVSTFLNSAQPTSDGLVSTLRSLSTTLGDLGINVDPASVSGGQNAQGTEIQFTVSFQGVRSNQNVPLSLGNNSMGLSAGPLATVSLTTSLSFSFTFGFDLTPGLSAADAFFIRPGSFNAGIDVTATAGSPLNFAARLGFLSVSVQGATGTLSARASMQVANPNGDPAGNITLNELRNTPLANLVSQATVQNALNFTLPVQATIGNFTFPGSPTIAVSASDIFNAVAPTFTPSADVTALLDFRSLTAGDFTTALNGLKNYLNALTSVGNLGVRLPGLNRTISSVVDHVNQFSAAITRFQTNLPQTAQEVAQRLTEALGNELGGPVAVAFSNDRVFRVNLSFRRAVSATLPFDVNVQQLGINLPGFVNVGGQGQLSVQADGTLNLHFGIDLSTPTTPRPVVFDTTGLTFNARFTGTNLSFTAAVGPLGFFVRGGSATLDRDGNPATPEPATFSVGLAPVAGGRYLLSALNTGAARISLTGAADLSLPLFFPTETQPLGGAGNNVFRVTVGDLTQLPGSVQIAGPNLSDVLSSLTQLDTSVQGIIDGVDRLLVTLQSALGQRVFSGLPVVGNKLADSARFIEDFRGTVMARLRQVLQGATDQVAARVQQAVFEALGPSGLRLIADLTGDGLITAADVQIVPTADQAQFNIRLGKTYDVQLTNGFDIGTSNLGLTLGADLNAHLTWSIDLGFGVHRTLGFYFDTTSNRELRVSAEATIRRLDVTGRLGFLRLQAQDTGTQPELAGEFNVDVRDPNGDGRLTFNEMVGLNLTDAIDARLTGAANVRLALTADFGSGEFPSVSTDFALVWTFGNAAPGSSPFGNRPEISFGNVRLNVGSFFQKLVRPVLNQVNSVLGPVKPVLDVLDKCIPVISNLAGSCTKLSALFGSTTEDFIALARRLVDFARTIPTNTTNLFVNFGSFDLGTTFDIRSSQLSSAVPRVTQTVASYLDQLNTTAGQPSRQFLLTLGTQPGGGLQFPILQNPSTVFKLFLGQDASLFTFDMPQLTVGFNFSQFFPFPPLPILGVRLGGGLNLSTRFQFGYDTTGIRRFLTTNNLLDLADGFFADAAGSGVRLTGGIQASAELNAVIASAGVGGGLEATIDFRLNDPNLDGKVRVSEVTANLGRGPSCIFDVAGQVDARLSAYFEVGVFPLKFRKDFNIARVRLLNFNYSCPSPQQVPPPPPQLAEVVGGVLHLNMGPRAANRGSFNTVDGDETFLIRPVSRQADGSETVDVIAFGHTSRFSGVRHIVANGGAGSDTILIDTGVAATASLDGGSGDDSLVSLGTGAVTLIGGLGNDELQGSIGNDRLEGREDNDLLDGGAANDVLLGGGGADVLMGGDGVDELRGEAGADVLDGGRGNDLLVGGTENDQLAGGDNDDVLQGESGADTLDGGAGNDRLEGSTEDDVLDGGAGNDVLEGGFGNDTLLGNGGADQLFGREGADKLYGEVPLEEPAFCAGQAGCAPVVSGPAGNDTLEGGSGRDLLEGGAGNDLLIGGATVGDSTDDADTLRGDAGNDRLLGDDVQLVNGLFVTRANANAASDALFGGDGNDTLFGGAGDDVLNGGRGQDSLFGESGGDRLEIGLDSADGPTLVDQVFGGPDRDVMVIVVSEVADDVNLCYANTTGQCTDVFGGRYRAEWFQANTTPRRSQALGAVTFNFLAGPQADIEELRIDGRGGNDVITVAPAVERNVILDGGDGNDTLVGGKGRDILIGGAGDDSLVGNGNEDLLYGGLGHDTLEGGDGTDLLCGDGTGSNPNPCAPAVGPAGNDRLDGGPDRDELFGGPGNDRLDAGSPPPWDPATPFSTYFGLYRAFYYGDKMFGEIGDDTLIGGPGRDVMEGGAGQDLLLGGDLGDDMDGGDNDVIQGVLRGDTLIGEAGRDTIKGGLGHDELHAFLKPGARAALGLAETQALTPEQRLDARSRLVDRQTNVLLPEETRLLNREQALLNTNPRTEQQETELRLVQADLRRVQDELTVLRAMLDDLQVHQSVMVDVLQGGRGNDTLFGSPFNDDLNGNEDDDTIVFAIDWANLGADPGRDTISGGDGIDTYMVTFSDLPEDIELLAHVEGPNTVGQVNAKIIGQPGDRREVARLERLDIEKLGVRAGGGDDVVTVHFGLNAVNLVDLDGEGGNDRLDATDMQTRASLNGGAGDDTLLGTAFDDVLFGSTGMDSVVGNAGFDIYRWQGTNNGDEINIQAASISGIEKLEALGGPSDDIIRVLIPLTGIGQVILNGEGGNDQIFAFDLQVPALLLGGEGRDLLAGGSANDTLRGGIGNDHLFGSAGNDELYGEEDNDFLYGQTGSDTLDGGAGFNDLNGDEDSDRLYLTFGRDVITGGAGFDICLIVGTEFGETIHVSGSATALNVSFNGVLRGVATRLVVEELQVRGRGGNDRISVNASLPGINVELHGDDGNDFLDAGAMTTGVTLYGWRGNDTLFGGRGDDQLHGGDNDDYLEGGIGRDRLNGDAGNDYLSGGSRDGVDTLNGGTGVDTAYNPRLNGVREDSTTSIESFDDAL